MFQTSFNKFLSNPSNRPTSFLGSTIFFYFSCLFCTSSNWIFFHLKHFQYIKKFYWSLNASVFMVFRLILLIFLLFSLCSAYFFWVYDESILNVMKKIFLNLFGILMRLLKIFFDVFNLLLKKCNFIEDFIEHIE